MPLFAIVCHDRPDAGTLRADTRPRHLEHLGRIVADIAIAGPLLDENDQPSGSIIIADFADLESATAFASADPYAEAGLFADVTVTAYRKVLP
jgi:uncharacterized protein YciI